MTQNFEIRRVKSDEWRELRVLRLRALKTDPLPFGSTYEETSQRPDSFWQSLAESGAAGSEHAVFAACFPLMLGMVRADRMSAETFGIYSMWVSPEIRKRGVAEKLLTEIEKWIAESGGKFCELFVADQAVAAQSLYLHCGYAYNGKTDDSPHKGITELGMTKAIRH